MRRIVPLFLDSRGCPRRCVFCRQDLSGGTPLTNLTPEALDTAAGPALAQTTTDAPVEIAFYGGTFSGLVPADRERLLAWAAPHLERGAVSALRISDRPDGILAADLGHLKDCGVKTVELGVQSLEDAVLAASGRGHTRDEAIRAAARLKETGLACVIHLMIGLPGDTPDTFRRTVDTVAALGPAAVRLHPTLVLRDTPLAEMWAAGTYRALDLDEAVALCREAVTSFRRADIPVIRLGLQANAALTAPGAILAGPWHPAFGERVEAALLLEKADLLLTGKDVKDREVTFFVPPGKVSAFRGQRNENLRTLTRRYAPSAIRVKPGETLRLEIGV